MSSRAFRRWAGSQAPGEQLAIDPAVGEGGFDRVPVLQGEDFGGSHQHGLMARRDRDQHRIHRHGRFAGPHVGLQQAVHGLAAGEVRGDLADGPVLPGGEGERKQPPNAGIDLGGGFQDRGLPLLPPGPPAKGKAQLKLEQIIKQQPPPTGFVLLPRFGEMQLR